MEYTLADLERTTGSKRRSVQLWSDRGVLLADPTTMDAGSGTHRRFSHDEAIIACAVHAFARQHMAIGELKEIAAAIRRAMANPKYRGALESDSKFGDDIYLSCDESCRPSDGCDVQPCFG